MPAQSTRSMQEAGIPWELSPANARDLEAAVDLLTQAGLPLDELENQFGPAYVLARRDGRLEGMAGLEVYGRNGFLRSVVVIEEAQKSGLGRLLVQNRLAESARLGLPAVYLLTMTAAPWFERFGFTPIPRTQAPDSIRSCRQFTSACPDSATLMVRKG